MGKQRHGNQTSSIIENSFGKGKAIFIGSLIACGYEVTKHKGNLKFFEIIAKKADVERFVEVSREKIRADVLYASTGMVLLIQNAGDYTGAVSLSFKSSIFLKSCIDTENKKEIDFIQENDIITISININAYDILFYILN